MARKAANEYTTHKTPYRCYVLPQFWHVGALPRAVIMGDMDRSFYYEGGPVAKDKGDQSGALGNKDSGKRGRGGDTVIGQTVPDKVKENLEKKGK